MFSYLFLLDGYFMLFCVLTKIKFTNIVSFSFGHLCEGESKFSPAHYRKLQIYETQKFPEGFLLEMLLVW